MDEYKMPTKQAPVNRLFYGHETNQQYREFLGNNFVYMQEYGLFFKKNDSESIDFTNPIKEEDMYLNLIDYGLKINSSIWNSLKNSSSIEKINPLTIFYNQLTVNKWDKKDRLSLLVKSMNLKYDFQENLRLIRKWFINTYSVAFREIDKQIDFMVFPRVVMILHSDQRAFGKTEFFRKIGLSGVMSKQFNNAGFDLSMQFPHLHQIKLYEALLNENEQIRSDVLLQDGLHLNKLGYEILKSQVDKALKKHI